MLTNAATDPAPITKINGSDSISTAIGAAIVNSPATMFARPNTKVTCVGGKNSYTA